MTGEESGFGGLDDPLNLHVCITKIMKPLIVIVPLLVMFTIIYIQVVLYTLKPAFNQIHSEKYP